MKIKLIQFQSGRALPPKILQVLPRCLLITTKKSLNAKQTRSWYFDQSYELMLRVHIELIH